MQNTFIMKKKYLVISLFVLLLAEFSMAQKSDISFFMTPRYVGPEENLKSVYVFTEMFYTIFSKKLRTTFPCATDIDEGSIRSMLGHQRELELLGGNIDENMKSISEAYN